MSWRAADDEKLLLEFAAWLTAHYGLGYLIDVLAKEFMAQRKMGGDEAVSGKV